MWLLVLLVIGIILFLVLGSILRDTTHAVETVSRQAARGDLTPWTPGTWVAMIVTVCIALVAAIWFIATVLHDLPG